MSKEKVFIVVSHKHSLKKNPKTGKPIENNWETTEKVEFVNQLRDRHVSMSSAIGDYINRKMISGIKHNITDYNKFEEYVRSKYSKQMEELDAMYRSEQITKIPDTEVFADQFGNIRAKNVFDI